MGLPKFSRFQFSTKTVHKGQVTWPLAELPNFLSRTLDDNEIEYYEVPPEYEMRPDSIANELYGSTELEWVLLYFNDITEVHTWPKAGDVIKYPIRSLVRNQLS